MIYMNTIILESRQKTTKKRAVSDDEEVDIQITVEENATN